MMLGIQPLHWLIIVIVALVIFGPKKLPEIGRWLAKGIRDFRNGMSEAGESVREATAEPAQAAQPSCPQCGASIRNDSQFCHKCGAKTASSERTCAECGTVTQDDSQFCHKCGVKLTV
jgi:sec-independent protein translocase protein TatA